MALIFATSNHHKFEEARELAKRYGIEIEHYAAPYIEIQADELEEIVLHSVQQVYALLKSPCFAEDAGLFIRAFQGFPGPYSNYVFRTIGNEGILKLMSDIENRQAEFRSTVGYCELGEKPLVFVGKVEGEISSKSRGSRGFGFDPIFVPARGDGRTFAEMDTNEKNKFSHRARALESFFKWYLHKK